MRRHNYSSRIVGDFTKNAIIFWNEMSTGKFYVYTYEELKQSMHKFLLRASYNIGARIL